MAGSQSAMANILNKITLTRDNIECEPINPVLIEADKETQADRTIANEKMKEEIEKMEKQLKDMKANFKLDDKVLTVYPNRLDLLQDYIEYTTLEMRLTSTKDVLRIRLLPLEDRIKQTGMLMVAIKEEDKLKEAMDKTFNMLSNNNKLEKLLKEIKEEEKDEKKDQPSFSRRLNKKEPKMEVTMTKTDKKAVFSLAIQEEEEEIPEADEAEEDNSEPEQETEDK